MHKRARLVRRADIVVDRPGGIEPMMVPVRLEDQNKPSHPKAPLDIDPVGKTSVGGVQWAYRMARPGLAAPMIVAKQDAEAAAKTAPAKQMGFWRR